MAQLGHDVVDHELLSLVWLMQLHQGTDHDEPEVAEGVFGLPPFAYVDSPKLTICGLVKVQAPVRYKPATAIFLDVCGDGADDMAIQLCFGRDLFLIDVAPRLIDMEDGEL